MRPPILHVIPFLWSGAGGVVTRLCEAQRRHGPVTIVTTGQPGEHADWPAYRVRLKRAGVVHHAIDFFHRGDGQFWPAVMALEAVIRELKPGVIHAHAGVPCCGAAIARATSGSRAKLIGQMYSWGPDRPEWMNRQDTWGMAQADRVVCSARAYSSILTRYGVSRQKLVYLPWGLPLDDLRMRSHSAGRVSGADAGLTVGFVGRIELRKGQLELVEAFARIRAKVPDARLELVGPVADAAYAESVRGAVARHGLEDAVTLAGEVRDVAARLRQWDLFVSLSSDEGQGLAVLEAMTVGVPVVARAVPGIEDFLKDGQTGFAVARPSARAVAEAVLGAWRAPAARARVARQARKMVERRYDWNQTVKAFERLYWSRS